MKRRLRQGAKLIVIDPRRTDLVRSPHIEAQHHLPLRPGTNVAVLTAMAHTIVTEGLVDEAFVRVRVYGWSARKVALTDIEWAAQDWCFWNEHYTNTVNPKKLVLLRRRSGVFKSFLISPPSPPEFLKELAVRGVTVR